MPHKSQQKANAVKTASADAVPAQQHASISVDPLPRAHPKPQPITTPAAAMTPQVAQISTKPEGNTKSTSTNPAPPPHHGVHTHKPTVFPDASGYPQEKKPLKKVSASHARLEKELKARGTHQKVPKHQVGGGGVPPKAY